MTVWYDYKRIHVYTCTSEIKIWTNLILLSAGVQRENIMAISTNEKQGYQRSMSLKVLGSTAVVDHQDGDTHARIDSIESRKHMAACGVAADHC